jgi:hypothetical protein
MIYLKLRWVDNMICKSKLLVISVVAVLLLSLSLSLVAAQYVTEKTTNVTISSDGTFTASESNVGVSYEILGTPGATGTVTAQVYNGNPQSTAFVPSGVSLTVFLVVSFNMDAADFAQATITISYTAFDVQNLKAPYAIFKYMPNTNSFVELPSTVDTNANTIMVTLTSLNDPLLAIGGSANTSPGTPAAEWAIIIVSAIIIVLLVVIIVRYMRRRRD